MGKNAGGAGRAGRVNAIAAEAVNSEEAASTRPTERRYSATERQARDASRTTVQNRLSQLTEERRRVKEESILTAPGSPERAAAQANLRRIEDERTALRTRLGELR